VPIPFDSRILGITAPSFVHGFPQTFDKQEIDVKDKFGTLVIRIWSLTQ
jgi:hypothetical protein